MMDNIPAPPPNENAKWLGLPVGYNSHPHIGVGAPNLTDASTRGLYHAVTVVPSGAIRALNSISTRLGAPAFASGAAPTITKQVYASGGAVRPISGMLPGFVHTGIGVVSIQARSMLDRVRGVFRR